MSEVKLPQNAFISLEKLYLDPNNYRFRNHKNYKFVEDKDYFNDTVQKRTQNIIIEQDGINDLLISFKTNSFLSNNPILVEKFFEDKFIVREGNRRIVALKALQNELNDSLDIGKLTPEVFLNIPVVFYEKSNSKDYFILMGLDHISGKKKWDIVNQAEMVRDLIKKYNIKPREVAESFGITLHRVNKNLRTLLLIDEYKKSDFKDQFNPKMFNIFDEITSKSEIKKWLDWNDSVDEDGNLEPPSNTENIIRLFQWISEEEKTKDEEIVRIPKKIKQGDDIRDLAKIINDSNALEELDRDDSQNALQNALENSGVLSENQFDKYIEKTKQDLINALEYAGFKKEDIYSGSNSIENKVNELNTLFIKTINKLKFYSILPPHQRKIDILETNPKLHLRNIHIISYKFLKDIRIENFQKINIIAGWNNSGKTTLLEAIHLLCNMNNPNGLYEVLRKRGKHQDKIPSVWIQRQLTIMKHLDLKGLFENIIYSTKIDFIQETSENIDKSNYLGTINFIASNGKEEYKTKSRILNNKFDDRFHSLKSISEINYFSPFTTLSWEEIQKAHESSVEQKSIDTIVEFIQAHLDPKIKSITKAGVDGDRFLVDHNDFEEAIDITDFGEGLQKVFLISLQFAKSKDGILLIDEVENAIHHGLFIEFTKFLQHLSNQFNVQVFLTTHSKECIDAFFENGLENKSISIFRLERKEDNQVLCKYVDGLLYKRLLENSIVDPRGTI